MKAMKRLVMTLVAAVMTLVASAQQSPLVLGKSHAMQRVGVTNKYLLLPVQEREDNATIKVLVNGRLLCPPGCQALWCRRDTARHLLPWRPSLYGCHEGLPLLEGDEVQRHFRHSQS